MATSTSSAAGMISRNLLKKGQTCHVYMSYCDNTESFWVQLVQNEEKLNDLQAEISEVYAEGFYSMKSQISVGTNCIAPYEKKYYRAHVDKIVNDTNCIVSFIDYGNSENVACKDLQRLIKTFTKLPAEAIHCSLPFHENTTPNFEISHLLSSEDLHITVFDIDANDKHYVQLKTSTETIPTMSKSHSANSSHVDGQSDDLIKPSHSYRPVRLDLNVDLPLVISHVPNEIGVFYCQLMEQHDELSTLMVDLQQMRNKPAIQSPKIGQSCVVLSNSDSSAMYRATITDSPQYGTYTVYYVDFGHSEVVPDRNVRPITSQQTNLPAQAIRALLADSSDSSIDVNTLLRDHESQSVLYGKATKKHGASYEMRVHHLTNSNGVTAGQRKQSGDSHRNRQSSLTQYKTVLLQADQQYTVVVTTVNSPCDMFAQFQQESAVRLFEELTQQIAQHCSCSPPEQFSPRQLAVGMPILAQYGEDKGWFRSVITGVSNREYDVFFVDYGNTSTVVQSQLRSISPSLMITPKQAVPCKLTGLLPTSNWTQGLIDSLYNMMSNETQNMRVMSFDSSDDRYFVEITDAGININAKFGQASGSLDPHYSPGAPIGSQSSRKSKGSRPQGGGTELPDGVNQNWSTWQHSGGGGPIVNGGQSQNSPSGSQSSTRSARSVSNKGAVSDLAFHKLLMEVGQVESVTVEFVLSPSKFYIQLCKHSDELATVMERMTDKYGDALESDYALSQAKIGLPCAAKFDEDGCWYRAEIVSMEGDNCEVMFVDYGNREWHTKDKLRLLARPFLQLPTQALCCSMDSLKPAGDDWTPEATDMFQNLTEAVIIMGKVMASNRGLYMMRLITREGGVNVGAELVNGNLARTDDSAAACPHSKTSAEGVTPSMLNAVRSSSSTQQSRNSTSSIQGNSSNTKTKVVLAGCTLSEGDSKLVTIPWINTPQDFYCQLNENEKKIEVLTQKMTQFYQSDQAGQSRIFSIGEYCAVPFEGEYHRCEVVKVTGHQLSIKFVDYGNVDTVATSEAKELSSEFSMLPQQSFQCKLGDVRAPVGTADWSKATQQRFEQLAQEQVTCTIMEVRAGVHTVALTDSADRNVAEQLPECTKPKQKSPYGQQPMNGNDRQGGSSYGRDKHGGFGGNDRGGSSYGHQDRQGGSSYGGGRQSGSSFGGERGESSFGRDRQRSGDDKQNDSFGNSRQGGSSFGQRDRQGGSFGGDRQGGSSFGGNRQNGSYGRDRQDSSFGSDKQGGSSFGGDRQGNSSSYGRDRQGGSFGGDRQGGSSFGGERQGGSSYGRDQQGGSFGGDKRGGSSFGDRQGGGSYGRDRQGGSFGGDRQGGSYGDRKGGSFGGGERQSYGQSDRQGGTFGGGRQGGGFGQRDSKAQSSFSKSANQEEIWEDEAKPVASVAVAKSLVAVEKFIASTIPDQSSEVYVSHVNTVHSFYVTVNNMNSIDQLVANLQKFYKNEKAKELVLSTVEVGQPCCALFSEDSSWYRAKVTEVNGDKITVLFVDFGNSETTELSNLRLLSTEFGKVPISAVRCRLHLAPIDCEVTQEAMEDAAMDQQEFNVKFITKTEPCDVVIKTDDKNLLELLEITPVELPERMTVDKYDMPELPDELPSCYATFTLTVDEIYLQVANIEELEDLTTKLQEFYNGPNTSQYVLTSVEIGMTCCALYSEDDSWYRAEVTKVEDDQVTVLFVDFGNSEVTELSKLRWLSSEVKNLSKSVVKCKLHDLLPNCKVPQEKLESLIADQELHVKFVTKDEPCSVTITTAAGTNLVELFAPSQSTPSAMPAELTIKATPTQPEPGVPAKISAVEKFKEPAIPDNIPSCLASVTNNVNDIHIQVGKPSELEELSNTLQDFYGGSKSSQYVMTSPKLGQPCCALFSEDGSWYRAQVIDIQGAQISVQYVDFGNNETTELSKLRLLSTEMKDLPYSAVKCKLSGLPADCNVTQDALENALMNKELNVTFVVKEKPYEINVMLADGSSLTDLLMPEEDEIVADEVLEKCKSAFLTHSENVRKFYVQLDENSTKIDEMAGKLENMEAELLDAEPSAKETLTVESLCLAQYEEIWYRAKVISLSENTNDVEVFFIDYGNCEKTLVDKLRPIIDELKDEPAYAVECDLEGVDVSEETTTKFSELLTDQELKILFTEDSNLVTVYLDKKNITQKLCAKPKKAPTIVSRAEATVLVEDPAVLEKCKTAFLTVIENAGKFYVQLEENSVKIDELAAKLEAMNDELLQSEPCTKETISVESLCCAPYEELWYRAKIVSLSEDGDDIEVFFIDYGNSETTEISKIRPIVDELKEEPAYAVECCLDSVEVTEETSAKFEELVTDQELKVLFVEKSNLVTVYLDQQNVATKLCAPLKPVPSTEINEEADAPQTVDSSILDECKIAFLTHTESVSKFYVQLDENSAKIAELAEKLEAMTEELSGAESCEKIDLSVDSLCLAQYDEVWYRAKIVSLSEDSDDVEVFFIDYGNSEATQVEKLKPICKDLENEPVFAIECCLENIEGSETTTAKFDELAVDCELHVLLSEESNLVTVYIDGKNIATDLQDDQEKLEFKVNVPELEKVTSVNISHIESPSELYVQNADSADLIESQASRLHEFYQSDRPEMSNIIIGDICCAKYSVDKSWYRAKVISLDGADITVQFIDYGNPETTTAQNLRQIDIQFIENAAFAMKCTMNFSSAATSEHTDKLWELSELHPILKMSCSAYDEHTNTATICLMTEDEKSIRDLLLESIPIVKEEELESPQSPDSQCEADATTDESQQDLAITDGNAVKNEVIVIDSDSDIQQSPEHLERVNKLAKRVVEEVLSDVAKEITSDCILVKPDGITIGDSFAIHSIEGTASAFTCHCAANDSNLPDLSDSEAPEDLSAETMKLYCRLAATQVIVEEQEEASQMFTKFCDKAGSNLTARVVGMDTVAIDRDTEGNAIMSVYLYDTSADDAEDVMLSINDMLYSAELAWNVPEQDTVSDEFNKTQHQFEESFIELNDEMENSFGCEEDVKHEFDSSPEDEIIAGNLEVKQEVASEQNTLEDSLLEQDKHDSLEGDSVQQDAPLEDIQSTSKEVESAEQIVQDTQEESSSEDVQDTVQEEAQETNEKEMQNTSQDDAEGTNQDDAEGTNQDDAESANQDDAESVDHDDAESANQDDAEGTNQDDAEGTNQDDAESTNHDDAGSTTDDEVLETGEKEVPNTCQANAEGTNHEQVQGTSQEEAKSTNHDEAKGTNQDEEQGTNQDDAKSTNEKETQSTSQEESQDTNPEESEGTNQDEMQDTNQEEAQGTNQDKVQATNQDKEHATNQDDSENTNQEEAQSTSEEESQGTSPEESESTNQDEMQDTNQEEAQGTNHEGLQGKNDEAALKQDGQDSNVVDN